MNWSKADSGYLYYTESSHFVEVDTVQQPADFIPLQEFPDSNIKILFCGGTISSWGTAAKGVKPDYVKTLRYISDINISLKLDICVAYEFVTDKLSQDYTSHDFDIIFSKIKNSKQDIVVVFTGTDRVCELAGYLKVHSIGQKLVLLATCMKSPGRPGCELVSIIKFISELQSGNSVLEHIKDFKSVIVLGTDSNGDITGHYPEWVYKRDTYSRGSISSKLNWYLFKWSQRLNQLSMGRKYKKEYELRPRPRKVLVLDDRFTQYSEFADYKNYSILIKGTGLGNIGKHNMTEILVLAKNNTILITSNCVDGPIRSDIYESGRIYKREGFRWNLSNFSDSFCYTLLKYTNEFE